MPKITETDFSVNYRKTIALVAHDNKKRDMAEWAAFNAQTLIPHKLISTGTTGKLVESVLRETLKDEGDLLGALDITYLLSGPLGGDQQLGAKIAEGAIDVVIFFWDPLSPHPHDVDVKALLRIAVVYNIPIACNRASADFLISSALLSSNYVPNSPDFSGYLSRPITNNP